MASDKVQYVVALIAEFAEHYGITTVEAAKYLSQYKALELFVATERNTKLHYKGYKKLSEM